MTNHTHHSAIRNKAIWALASLLFVGICIGRYNLDKLYQRDKRYVLTPPPRSFKYFSFGFNESIGDFLWLRYIQDFQKCKLVGMQDDQKAACSKGWAFQMLDQITELAPRFRMAYLVGPISLSVLTSDFDGANVLFERAIRAYPDDWTILYRASYHFLYDKKDNYKAASLLLAAYKHGGPEWLPLLAAKLYSKEGQLEFGISALKLYQDQVKEPQVRKFIKQRLATLYCEKDHISHGLDLDEAACAKQAEQETSE